MLVTVANTKGGVGKTTLAFALALERALSGRDVWYVDCDRQATGQTAIAVRAEAGLVPPVASSLYPDASALRTQVRHQSSRFDDVVIDVGGRDSTALRAALLLCDVLLVPFQPRTYDVWALDDMASLIEDALTLRDPFAVYAVLNLADPGDRSRDNDEAREAVARRRFYQYVPVSVRRRKAFANAAGSGRSVREIRPVDRKAVSEISALAECVFAGTAGVETDDVDR